MKVEWTATAHDRLIQILRALPDSEADAAEECAVRITSALATDPNRLGESREKNWRIWYEEHLVVLFRIDPRVVVVMDVDYRNRRRGP